MNNTLKILSMWTILIMAACGGTTMEAAAPEGQQEPAPQEEPAPQPEPPPNIFVNGEFMIRDHNCAGDISITRFRTIVADEGVLGLTVIEASPLSPIMNGDIFIGRINGEGTVATFDALLCVATYVSTPGGEQVFRDNLQIDVEYQDMVGICAEGSPDGNCSLSYARVK